MKHFNAKGNVYSRINKEPFYELVWENRQIIQMNGGMANDSNFSGCLLDNGQVWALDNSEFEIFSYGESEFTQNDSGWIHLDFYDDKKVKSILAMESAIYVLCESPEQKLYYHCNGPQIQTEYDEDEEEINNSPPLEPEDPLHPVEDKSMSSKTIIKMVCISEIIFCCAKKVSMLGLLTMVLLLFHLLKIIQFVNILVNFILSNFLKTKIFWTSEPLCISMFYVMMVFTLSLHPLKMMVIP